MKQALHSAGSRSKAATTANAFERLVLLQLTNRYLWLIVGLAFLVNVQLAALQFRPRPWFETVDLISHQLAVVEIAMLGCVLLLALGLPAIRGRYLAHSGRDAQPAVIALAAAAALMLAMAASVAPLMLLNRYSELAAEGVSFPLTILQRAMLLLFALLTTYNIVQVLRLYLRLPDWAVALGAVLWHVAAGVLVTYLSFTRVSLQRLNDVYYYAQLNRYSESFPDLKVVDENLGQVVFHNIEMPWFGYYLFAAVFIWLLSFFMWLPRTTMLKPVAPVSDVEAH